MVGNIYTSQKCFICNGKFTHIEDRKGCYCKNHPEVQANKGFIVRFGRQITKRFKVYDQAYHFLIGLRFKAVEGSLDIRDYKADKPISFRTMASLYLEYRQDEMSVSAFREIKRYLIYAINYWGDQNIKTIGYADFEDFLKIRLNEISKKDKLSYKTINNAKSALQSLFKWVHFRDRTIPIPDFPKIKYTLGYRNILDVKDQASVLNEIHRISYSFNPRIYIGILWLCTYPGIRPNEMRNLKEKHINMNGYLIIPAPKEKRYKKIAMSDEDIDLYQSVRPIGKPDMYFFRHIKGNGTAKPGNQFGKDYFYKWWKSACKNLGIEGVDLYGGTRHSTLSMLQTDLSEEEIMRHASMHSSNIALRRYIRGDYKSQINVQRILRNKREGLLIPINSRKDSTQK